MLLSFYYAPEILSKFTEKLYDNFSIVQQLFFRDLSSSSLDCRHQHLIQ